MKRIIAASLVALFVLVGGGLALACTFDGPDSSSGPAVLFPTTGGSTSTTSTPEVPAGTVQPNG